VFVRFHRALKELQPHRPLPEPLPLTALDEFLQRDRDRYRVDWQGMQV
jgi:hypothetical protein